jgi:hypothetical protein
VSTEVSSASTPIPELPRGHENSLLLLLDKQTGVIKVEKLSKYSPHSILVHDSLPDEKLLENSQSDLPGFVNIRNYLSIGRIHSLWSNLPIKELGKNLKLYRILRGVQTGC